MAFRDLLKKNGYEPTAETVPTPTEGTDTPDAPGAGKTADGNPDAQAQPGGTGGAPSPLNEDDISEELIIKALNKRTGRTIASLSDLESPAAPPTEQELQQQAADRENEIRTFALQNKLVTSTDFDQYAQEISVPYDSLARRLYMDERLQELRDAKTPEDQMPTQQELDNEFDEVNFRFADDKDPKRKAADKRMQREVKAYLSGKYGKIQTLEQEYARHTSTQAQRNSYSKTVDEVFTEAEAELAELTFDIPGENGQSFTYKYKVKPEDIRTMKATYQTDHSFNVLGQGTVEKSALKAAIQQGLTSRLMKSIITEVAKAHSDARLEQLGANRRNILDHTHSDGLPPDATKAPPGVQRMLNKNNVKSSTR